MNLLCGVFLRIGGGKRVAGGRNDGFSRLDDVKKVRVSKGWDNKTDGVFLPGFKVARNEVRHIGERLNGVKYHLFRLIGDKAGAVDYRGNGGRRDTGDVGNILKCRTWHCQHLIHFIKTSDVEDTGSLFV